MNNTRQFTIALVAFALLTLAAVPTFAQAPASLPVQGYLTDAEGAPLEGATELTFTIYNASGDALFTSTQSAELDRGAFSVVLGGQGGPLDLTIFRDNSVLQLGVAVDDGAELSPRFDIATSPFAGFAQYSGDAATLEGLAATDFAQVGDSLGGLNCSAAGEVPTWDGASWTCGSSSDTVGDLTCMAGQVAAFDGSAWSCNGGFAVAADLATVATSGSFADLSNVPADLADGDNDTTYTAGSGLTLSNGQFSLNAAALDSRFVNEGQAGAVTSAMIANGAITTAKLENGSVTQAKLASDSVDSSKVALDSLTSADIAGNAIGTSELASNSVREVHIDFQNDLSNADFDPIVTAACPFGDSTFVDFPPCDEVLPGSFCDYDAGNVGITLDPSLDNCSTLDVYVRTSW